MMEQDAYSNIITATRPPVATLSFVSQDICSEKKGHTKIYKNVAQNVFLELHKLGWDRRKKNEGNQTTFSTGEQKIIISAGLNKGNKIVPERNIKTAFKMIVIQAQLHIGSAEEAIQLTGLRRQTSNRVCKQQASMLNFLFCCLTSVLVSLTAFNLQYHICSAFSSIVGASKDIVPVSYDYDFLTLSVSIERTTRLRLIVFHK